MELGQPMTVPSQTFEEKQMFLDQLKSLLPSSILIAAFHRNKSSDKPAVLPPTMAYLFNSNYIDLSPGELQEECISVVKFGIKMTNEQTEYLCVNKNTITQCGMSIV